MEEVDSLVKVLTPWAEGSERETLILHIQHVDTPDLELPEFPLLFHLASTLLDNKRLVEKALLGTVLQAKALDPPALLARDVFLGLYKPKKELLICDSDADASRFLRDLFLKQK